MPRGERIVSARALAALILVGASILLASPAAAQATPINPIVGDYEDIYIIAGRAVDSNGQPMAGANVTIQLDQKGVKAAPLTAKVNCYGDFITYFNLRHVEPRGKAHITVQGEVGQEGKTTVALDPLLRRSDAAIRMSSSWGYYCPEEGDLWPGRLSVTGRVVNRTTPYEVDGVTYDARPYVGYVRVTYVDEYGLRHCPPSSIEGKCEPIPTDKRGDFRYSYTFNEEVEGVGTMLLEVGNKTYNTTLAEGMRLAVFHVDLSRDDTLAPAAVAQTPGPAVPLMVCLVAVAALLRRR